MKIQESAENYLETILVLKERKGLVRSIDIANELEFSKPSVSIAMRNLRENGYVSMDAGGFITLLPAGQEIAERIYERHRLLTKWLTGLGVDPAIASEDACRIEHVVSAKSFKAIKAHSTELIDQHTLRADVLIAHNISNGILAPIAFFSHTNPHSKRWRRQSISD